MQWLAHSIWALYLLILLISGGQWYLGTELQNAGIVGPGNANGLLQRSLNMTTYASNYNATSNGLSVGNGFNALFIFGDPLLGASNFFGIISGGAVIKMEQMWGFAQSFQQMTAAAVLGLPGIGALVYYLSNRP